MKFTVKQNNPITINLNNLVNYRDWTFEGGVATHISCNTDQTQLIKYANIKVGTKYTISYELLNVNSGWIELSGGGVTLPQDSTPGAKTFDIITETTEPLIILSNGDLQIKNFSIVSEIIPPTTQTEGTVTWSEKLNRWISFRSYVPEAGFSMFTDLFTYKNGDLYKHSDQMTNRNSFYGENYESVLKFVSSSAFVKNFQSLAVHSNKMLLTTEDGISTDRGQTSDLVEEDFSIRESIFYADFRRDKNVDIINGPRLKGRYQTIELTDTEPQKPLELFKVVVKSQISTPNE